MESDTTTDTTGLSENPPATDFVEDGGPLGTTLAVNEAEEYGEVRVQAGALGYVVSTSDRFDRELEAGERQSLPAAGVLRQQSRSQARYEGRECIGRDSEAARETWVNCYTIADTQLMLRWEYVEAAVRWLLDGDEYDPAEFALVDMGIQGFVLVREAGEPIEPAETDRAMVLLSPSRERR